jgi:large subunit ribosomal protein L6
MTGSSKTQTIVDIPSDVEIKIEDTEVRVSGPKGSLTRTMTYPGVTIKIKDGMAVITTKNQRRAIKAMAGTFAAHIKNMISGVTKGFECTMKVVYSHFPITVKHSGDVITIDNFLGEKTPRKSRVFGDCNISIKGDTITVSGVNIEEVGQTTANIEKATKVKGRDRRVFQDGIYLVEKGVATQ